jgi:murein DD-endopeptidase MepM/ murein hydrolase activator NlpD
LSGENGLLYAVGDWNSCGNGRLVIFNAIDGTIFRDHGDCPGTGNTSPHPRQNPALDRDLDSVYFGSTMLCSVDMDMATNNWASAGGFYIGERGIAVDSSHNIYYATYNGAMDGRVKVLSFNEIGEFRWEETFSPPNQPRIIGMTKNDTLLLYNPGNNRLQNWDTNGNQLWSFENLDLCVTDKAGRLYASASTGSDVVSLNPDGTERWRKRLTDATWVKIDFIDNTGHIYVRGNNTLYALSTTNGDLVWRFSADSELTVASVLLDYGRLLLFDSQQNIYLLDTRLNYAASDWAMANYGNRRHTQKLGDVLPVPPLIRWPVRNSGVDLISQKYAVFNGNPNNPKKYHTGIDIHAEGSVLAVKDGKMRMIQENGGQVNPKHPCKMPAKGKSSNCSDHGYGNTVIIEHQIPQIDDDPIIFYSQYSHLASISEDLKNRCGTMDPITRRRVCINPVPIKIGEFIGNIGSSCYGDDACTTKHLHFELKKFNTLGTVTDDLGLFGYTEKHPDDEGYIDPIEYLHGSFQGGFPRNVTIAENNVNLRSGPGRYDTEIYPAVATANNGLFNALRKAEGTTGLGASLSDCPQGWYQIQRGGVDCKKKGNCFNLSNNENSFVPDAWVCGSFIHN